MRIYVCMSCGKKNKIGGSLKGRSCKYCGASLDTQDRSKGVQVAQNPANLRKPNKKERKEQDEVKKKEKYSGEFSQHGVLCLYCKTVTRFGNKKCQNCKKKLKITPWTTVYYNGIVEAVQCRKCGEYTDVKGLKCEHCSKTIKF